MTETRYFPNSATPDAAGNAAGKGAGKIARLPGVFQAVAPTYPAVETVVAHWEALRGRKLAPARSEVDPRILADCLDVLFVAETVAPGVARIRLCGQQFTELLGMEPRGMPLSVLFAPEARNNLATAVRQVSQGVRAVLPLRAEKGFGRPGLDGLLVLMPLADRDGNITRILGVLETHGQIGRAPRKFRLTTPQKLPQTAPQTALQSTPQSAPQSAPQDAQQDAPQMGIQTLLQAAPLPRGMERQARTPVPAPERPKGKPVLRLITGGLSV